MLSQQTQTILKSLLQINNSFVVQYPKFTIIDEFKSLPGVINISAFETEFEEFGIFDGANFLSALDLLQNPVITLKGNMIQAKDENSVMNFVTSDPSSLEESCTNEKIITTTEAVESVMEFIFNVDTISKIKKAAGIFKTMDTLFLVKSENDSEVYLKIGSKTNFVSSDNSYSLKIQPTINKTSNINLAIPLENILKLPQVDYICMVKYNEEKDMHRIILKNEIYTFLLSLMK